MLSRQTFLIITGCGRIVHYYVLKPESVNHNRLIFAVNMRYEERADGDVKPRFSTDQLSGFVLQTRHLSILTFDRLVLKLPTLRKGASACFPVSSQ